MICNYGIVTWTFGGHGPARGCRPLQQHCITFPGTAEDSLNYPVLPAGISDPVEDWKNSDYNTTLATLLVI
jgi:hypothetical protein